MKLTCLLLLALAFCVSCQQSHYGSRPELNDTFAEPFDLSLLTLQYLTVEFRRDNGRWVDSKADYFQAFKDSASVVMTDFDELGFRKPGDTLVISYALKELRQKAGPTVAFVNLPANERPAKGSGGISIQHAKNTRRFRKNEGELAFSMNEDGSVSIIHEYSGAMAKNSIFSGQR